MRLYHGTTERWLEPIMRGGIQPRGEGDGNWEEYPSRPDMVYLTTAYPLYFAAGQAAEGERLVILELELDDLDHTLLFPDEDVVAQSIAHQTGRPLPEVHREVVDNLEVWQDKWPEALEAMGNVAHQGPIPPEAIQRAAVIDPEARGDRGWLFMAMLDPSISILNYKVKGSWYAELVEWVMGHRPHLPGGMELEALKQLDQDLYERKRAFLEEQERDRSGIAIYTKEVWDKRVKGFQ